MADSAASAIRDTLSSPNVADSNLEPANVVDVLHSIANSTRAVARAITPANAAGSQDAAGGHVESLTEAVMGMTQGLCQIADAIQELAAAVRESKR